MTSQFPPLLRRRSNVVVRKLIPSASLSLVLLHVRFSSAAYHLQTVLFLYPQKFKHSWVWDVQNNPKHEGISENSYDIHCALRQRTTECRNPSNISHEPNPGVRAERQNNHWDFVPFSLRRRFMRSREYVMLEISKFTSFTYVAYQRYSSIYSVFLIIQL